MCYSLAWTWIPIVLHLHMQVCRLASKLNSIHLRCCRFVAVLISTECRENKTKQLQILLLHRIYDYTFSVSLRKMQFSVTPALVRYNWHEVNLSALCMYMRSVWAHCIALFFHYHRIMASKSNASTNLRSVFYSIPISIVAFVHFNFHLFFSHFLIPNKWTRTENMHTRKF